MKNFKFLLFGLITLFFLQSCGIYDLRTKDIKQNGIQPIAEKKGRAILEKAWKAQGMDKLSNFKTYTFHGKDSWKGLLGGMGKIWKDKKSELEFRYRINTFDGQVHFLDGKDKGTFSGLQDWKYYDITEEGTTTFLDKNAKENRRKVFGIAAYQFFTEMIDRLKKAPIILYAGEDEFRGQQYDLVFCTWGKVEPHMENDQYVAWVNKKTGLLDFTQYTIRETYLKPPGYKKIGGAVEFTNYKEVNGILIPHHQIVYAIKLRKKQKKNLHELHISNFKFDAFEETALQVDKNSSLGDASKK